MKELKQRIIDFINTDPHGEGFEIIADLRGCKILTPEQLQAIDYEIWCYPYETRKIKKVLNA